jgi:hypothetical protein
LNFVHFILRIPHHHHSSSSLINFINQSVINIARRGPRSKLLHPIHIVPSPVMATGSTAASSAKESSDDDADRSENGEDDGLGVASSKSASKNLEDDEDVILNSSNQPPNDYAWERRLLETLARVSLASVGGGLVGLSLDHKRRQQRQQQQQQPHHQYSYPASSRTTATTTAVSGNRPRQRPPLSAKTAAATSLKRGAASLAKTWSVSCFLFATILETTRWISPTTVLYDFISQQQQQQHQQGERENVNDNSQTNSSPSTRDTPDPANAGAEQHSQQLYHSAAVALQRLALTVAGDYTIGGSLAGFMVASLAQQQHAMISRSIRLPLPVFGRAAGVGLGTALGLCAGLVQATIAVGEMYIQQQQQEQ